MLYTTANYTICNFDTDFCGWETLNTSDTKWNIMKEGAPFDSRLPERDQTTKSGHGERLCTHIYETFLMMPI